MRYTEARLTEAAQLILQDYDDGTVDFRETYDGEDKRTAGSARRLPEPAGQWLGRHRRGHGDQYPAP
jgi:hypothetical protein